MQFVFWQNVLSIHQSSFLRTLSLNHNVILVVEKEMNEKRLKEGWNKPDMGNIEIIINPSDNVISKIIDSHKNSIHVFSGIQVYPLISKAFTLGQHMRVRTLVLAEPFNFLGIKGLLRCLKKRIQFFKYSKGIHGLLHTGELGRYWFKKAGFPSERLFHWGYFTEDFSIHKDETIRKKPSILFVGSIDERKNILELVSVAQKNADLFETFTIVGKGPLEDKLNELIKDNFNIKYIGALPNEQVHELMCTHDIFILPSIFDGWGAVINEALQNGMQVICSENCGAYSLLSNKERGEVFYFKDGDNLDTILKKWLNKGPLTVERRNEIIEWSKHSISGIAITDYFIQVCKYIFEKKGEKPVAPWLT